MSEDVPNMSLHFANANLSLYVPNMSLYVPNVSLYAPNMSLYIPNVSLYVPKCRRLSANAMIGSFCEKEYFEYVFIYPEHALICPLICPCFLRKGLL